MKKKNFKLALGKKKISSFRSTALTGGTRTSNLCSVYCSLQGGCGTTGPAPTNDDASQCKCL
ncbi:hypothetical protein [Kordia jejudonensis]|uniref:hypothetical protein n=1 Tax=Kordia jejudonensis TaxID=1348245 RepID=UPI0012DFF2D7|nr:hypothetical protein [Kordia jejudonensis]